MKNKDRFKNGVIAIDFDGTITLPSPYPITGKIRQDAIDVILKLQKKYILVLWTCRQNEELQEALDLLRQNGVIFDYVNKSPYDKDDSHKIRVDIFIDDKNFYYDVNWQDIEKKLL